MVNIKAFELSREELEARLRAYENRYGAYIKDRGLHNWKNLFKKPRFSDWMILFMLIMVLFVAWSYSHDIKACRDYINQQQAMAVIPDNPLMKPGLNLTFKEETSGKIGDRKDNNT